MTRKSDRKRVLLVGAGHAHLHVIANAWRFAALGHLVTVLAPGNFWYSGMATGMLGGGYDPAEDQVNIQALAERNGARFIRGAVTAFDIPGRCLSVEGEPSLPFDVLSLNVGSFPPEIPGGDGPGCYRVKPIIELARLREDLLSRFAVGHAPVRVIVAGGGATGAELAANIDGLARRSGARIELKLVTGNRLFLNQLPRQAGLAIATMLERRGVELVSGRVAHIAAEVAQIENGVDLPFDIFLNATGLKPSPLLRATGLPVDPSGALRVDAQLRSIADSSVHGAGDCIALEGHALAKIGVYAIRQAPVLLANLLAAAGSGDPKTFSPQPSYLWIVNLGDGTGLAMRGGLWWRGRSAFWLKDRIDRRFMNTYRQ